MKLHANARTCPHCRSLIVSRIIDDRQSISAVALEFRVSLPTVRQWLKRHRAQGTKGLSDEDDEVFFSIDEFGPVAVKMRGGTSLQGPNEQKVVPQWQKSRGCFILNAVLELSKNQITYMFTEAKNTGETIQLIELLRRRYTGYRRMFLSWDAAPRHSSTKLRQRIDFLNELVPHDRAPSIQVLPLPTSAQFPNVIESVFGGLARAVLHNSDYASVEDAKAAASLYLDDRNPAFKREPRRAGKLIWKMERARSEFLESNNCKDSRYS